MRIKPLTAKDRKEVNDYLIELYNLKKTSQWRWVYFKILRRKLRRYF